MEDQFSYDDRLGIWLPHLTQDWQRYDVAQRQAIVAAWELVRGGIPERIIQFERLINEKQGLVFEVEDFETCCQLNLQIADYASRINDLHIWYRINQDVEARNHH